MTLPRPLDPADHPALLALAERSGLFDADGVAEIARRLAARPTPADDLWLVLADAQAAGLRGAVYAAAEVMTDRTWNALMLIVDPDQRGVGLGQQLMRALESELGRRGARLLIVETSGSAGFERTRRFYGACGYREAARLPEFYSASEDKVVFVKPLAQTR